MHVAVNMIGARRRCSVVLMLGHRRQWGIGLACADPITFIPGDDRLLYTALFPKSITLQV